MNATDGYGEMCNDLRTSWDDEERVLNQARRSRKEVVRSIAQWLLSCTCFTVPMCPGTAPAMDFKIYAQPQLPLKMVIAEGRIQDGDAEKFTAFADMADVLTPDSYGRLNGKPGVGRGVVVVAAGACPTS